MLKELYSTSQTSTPNPCSSCGHTSASIVRMPSFHAHYAALKCGGCDRFITWMQKPETEGKRRDLAVRLDKLVGKQGLTNWEREFLESLQRTKKLSPRQQETLTRIEAKVGVEN